MSGRSLARRSAAESFSAARPAGGARLAGGVLAGGWPGLAVLAAALIAAPLVLTTPYEHGVLVTFSINLILLVGLNLIVGYARQLSLGHAGFYGLGAYTAGIVTAKLGWPPLVGFLLAPAVAAVAALIVGVPSLRLRGLYFAMATLGAGTVLFLIFGRAVELTGGPNGLLGVPRFTVLGIPFSGPLSWYWVGAAFAFLGIVATRNLLRSRLGRGLRALGISEPGAAAVGVDAFRLKLVIFVAAAAYAGVAGAIQTFQARFVGPETFNFFATVILVVILTLSGAGTLWGPLVGAVLLTGLDEFLTGYNDYKPLLLGLAFLVVLRVFPRGIVGEAAQRLEQATEPHGPGTGPETTSAAGAEPRPSHAAPGPAGSPATGPRAGRRG
jgi:branched-chain amino acid transport system permease protein